MSIARFNFSTGHALRFGLFFLFFSQHLSGSASDCCNPRNHKNRILVTVGNFSRTSAQLGLDTQTRSSTAIFQHFLSSLERQQRRTISLGYLFLDQATPSEGVQENKSTLEMLLETFTPASGEKVHIEQGSKSVQYVLEYASKGNYDYILFIEPTVVLQQTTLEWFALANKPVLCASLINYPPARKSILERNPPPTILANQDTYYPQQQFPKLERIVDSTSCPCFLVRKESFQKVFVTGPVEGPGVSDSKRSLLQQALECTIPIYLDHHLPAYQILSKTDEEQVDSYIRNHRSTPLRLTLSLLVKNEAKRYLQAVLASVREYVTDAVIIDDGSHDESAEMCRSMLDGIPLRLIQNRESKFANEVILRKQQWEETVKTNPDWILTLDADEIFEGKFKEQVGALMENVVVDAYYFRLYDFWNETHYRSDKYWQAHTFYRPFMVRYRPEITYCWRETVQHCGRFPLNISKFPMACSDLRLKHYGWSHAQDRIEKYNRYQQLDPNARYGWKEQYESILDPAPHLLEWVE